RHRVRDGPRSRGGEATGGRRGVRPHPPAGPARGRTDPLLQHRRLGRELHGAARALRRASRARVVGPRGRRPERDDARGRGVSLVALAIAAVLLAAERACYVVIARRPDLFLTLYARLDPRRQSSAVAVVERLFFAFKGLQFGVFRAWSYVPGGRFPFPPPHGPFVMGLCWALAVAGQVLVVSTFYRLGRAGVFFGDRFGYAVPRCRAFPFSLLAHPQYVGPLLTIWGGFMLVRFPHDDWWALPLLETVYYLGGMWLATPRARFWGGLSPIPSRV